MAIGRILYRRQIHIKRWFVLITYILSELSITACNLKARIIFCHLMLGQPKPLVSIYHFFGLIRSI